jgi:hypothetical protein
MLMLSSQHNQTYSLFAYAIASARASTLAWQSYPRRSST